MASKRKKQVEKLGAVIGRSRPFTAVALLLIGVFLLVSIFHYSAGQEVIFKHYFEPLLPSTESGGFNICGRFGATLALSLMLIIGAATYMLPLYVIWFGIGCFRRRASIITKSEVVAVVVGLLSLSMLSSVFQDFLGDSAPLQSATFPSGWGGKFGFVVFGITKPLLDSLGNVLIFGTIYLMALVVVFVESPSEALKELVSVLKWCVKMLWRLLKAVFIAILLLPKKLVLALFARKKNEDEQELVVEQKNQQANESEEKNQSDIVAPDDDFSIKEIDLRDLEDFAKEMGSSSRSSALVDILEVDSSSEEPIMVESEQEESVSDFTGVEIDLSKHIVVKPEMQSDVASASKDNAEGGQLEVVSAKESEKLAEAQIETRRQALKKKTKYVFPSLNLLSLPEKNEDLPKENYNERISEIVGVIGSFGVKVIPDKAYPGPVITRYEVKPAAGVKISRIANLGDDITAGIRAQSVRIIAPVPGRGTVGIEVPNINRQNVSMREVLQSKMWRETKAEIPIALGKDATGVPIVANLKKMTHALIAGSTNSGKSVCINTIIVSMLYKMTPEDLRLIMIDPKMVELQVYNSIPHMLIPVVCDVKKAAAALKWLTSEMMRRYQIFNKTGVRNIDGFNAKILKDKEEMLRAEEEFAQMSVEERQAALATKDELRHADDVEIPDVKMPYIVCIVDELADLMSVVGKEVEQYIARITQLARAAGIHMIIATQRPDVKVITGMIKNNLPTRIAFKVTSQIDSRTILDRKGAETLIGWGDMLFLNNGTAEPVRAQGAFLSDGEIESIVEALKVNGEPQYAEEVQNALEASDEDSDDISEGEGGKYGDPMTVKAINVIRVSNKASTSLLQRKLGIGYGRAARIIDELEDRGIIGPDNGTGKRELFLDNL